MHAVEQGKRERRNRIENNTQARYGNEWDKLSKRLLSENQVCELCGDRSELVHHIVDRRKGGSDQLDNLMILCHKCHNQIHAREKLHAPKRYTY